MLSGWAAMASIVINLILAFQLSLTEYGIWVKHTALLPLVSVVLAPLILMCSRVNPEQEKQSRQARRILVLIALCSGIMAIVFSFSTSTAELTLKLGISLWLAAFCKSALDGVIWSPEIVHHGMLDKSARSVTPSFVLFAFLVFQPSTAANAIAYMTGTTGLCSLVVITWIGRYLHFSSINSREILLIYFKELPSVYLTLMSLGVFSLPLFIFSHKSGSEYAAVLGVSLLVVQGASTFSTILLGKQQLMLAQMLSGLGLVHKIKIGAPTATVFICFFLVLFLVGGYALYKNISFWLMLAVATGILVLVESSQGLITGLLLRLGDRMILLSATVSAIINTTLSFTLSDPISLIWLMAFVQFFSFLLPGLVRINKFSKARGSIIKLSFM
jgi:hypothetical protein